MLLFFCFFFVKVGESFFVRLLLLFLVRLSLQANDKPITQGWLRNNATGLSNVELRVF